jgi:hypothetical protein
MIGAPSGHARIGSTAVVRYAALIASLVVCVLTVVAAVLSGGIV